MGPWWAPESGEHGDSTRLSTRVVTRTHVKREELPPRSLATNQRVLLLVLVMVVVLVWWLLLVVVVACGRWMVMIVSACFGYFRGETVDGVCHGICCWWLVGGWMTLWGVTMDCSRGLYAWVVCSVWAYCIHVSCGAHGGGRLALHPQNG
jgi:hypothetical protein